MIEAIEDKGQGTIIHVKIKIGKKNFISGYDSWRKRIEIELKEKPVNGRANRELISFLSEFFGVGIKDLKIIYGEKSREKGIYINADKNYILKRLENGL
ncbi:MAG: YggU family protein [Thermoplasmata archaeon]|nr:YggU family protein [Thermoplasmata archaeon]